MSVTSEYRVKGLCLALEQCGLLAVRDGVSPFYEDVSYATAVVLAAFAREELWAFLKSCWQLVAATTRWSICDRGAE